MDAFIKRRLKFDFDQNSHSNVSICEKISHYCSIKKDNLYSFGHTWMKSRNPEIFGEIFFQKRASYSRQPEPCLRHEFLNSVQQVTESFPVLVQLSQRIFSLSEAFENIIKENWAACATKRLGFL